MDGGPNAVYAFKNEIDEWSERRHTLVAQCRRPWRARLPERWLVYALLGLAILCAGVFLLPRSTNRTVRAEAVPFSTGPGLEMEPRVSPDGRVVAYTWNGVGEDNFDIYTKAVGGGAAVRITTDPAHEYSPAWSPDGTSLAFARQLDPARIAVCVARADGSSVRVVAELPGASWPHWHLPGPILAWSRDGRQLAVSARPGEGRPVAVFRVSLENGIARQLTFPEPPAWGDFSPSFSSDGRLLAFSRCTGWGLSDIHILPLTSGLEPARPEKKLPSPVKWNASPSWLPDSKSLVFSLGTMDVPSLAIMDHDGSSLARLAPAGDQGWQPAPARTSAGRVRIAYTRHLEVVNIWKQNLAPGGGAAPQGAPSRLIASSRRDLTPEYSPDGRWIAFTSDRSGAEEIWIAAADGSDQRQWTSFEGAHVGAPHWSRDSRSIAFDAEVDRRFRIYTIASPSLAASAREPLLVADNERAMWHPIWSPDGSWIYFVAQWSGDMQIWRIPALGGRPEQVKTVRGDTSRFSPDGKTLFFSTGGPQNHLWRMPAGGGEAVKVMEWVGDYAIGEKGIYFTRYRPGEGLGDPAVYFLPFGGSHPEKAVPFTALLRPGLALSPDGRTLLYTQVEYDVSDIMLTEVER